MKRKLLLATLCVVGALGMRAQTDVTSTYLVNPSFELGTDGTAAASGKGNFTPYGWTLTESSTSFRNSEINSSSSETSSSFGAAVTPADGNYYFFGRHSWKSALQMTLSQTAASLPAGKYSLSVAYKIANQLTGTNGTLKLKAIQDDSELNTVTSPIGVVTTSTTYFNTAGWTRLSVPFTVSTTGDVTLQLYLDFNPNAVDTKQEAIIIDDVKLYSLSAASPTDPADVTGFLVNQSFELDTYTGTKDASSTGSSGSLNYPTGWTFMLGTSGWNNCINVTDAPSHGMYARETWAATINELQIYQSLTGLPKGVYEICADARTNDASANDICTYGKVGDDVTYSTAWDQSKMNATWNGADNWQTLSSIFAVGDAGTAEVGLHSTHFMQFDNFTFKYYGDVTVAEVKLAAYVSAYNAALAEAQAFTEESMYSDDWTALQTAITANTLDLNDAGLTESDLTTATENLVAANTAASAAVTGKTNYETATTLINGGTNIDLTSMIINPSFELGNANGWTSDGTLSVSAQSNKAFDNTQGNIYAEKYHTTGTIDLNQTIKYLPVGIYQASAYMYSSTGDATFYVNSESVDVSTSANYFAVVEIADKGSIKIGATCNSTSSTWVCMDGFELKYLASSYAALPYTLATGKMGTDKSAAQTEAEAAFTANPNMTTYNALLTAIAAAEASVANYAALKAAIDKAEDVKDANNFVTADATTTLESEINTATNAWTDVTYTDAQATAEIAVLGSAVSGWHAIASEGKAGAFMASAWSKTSENWWNAPYINTWSVEGDNDGTGFSVPFFEYFTGNTDNLAANTFTATLTGMEAGGYAVEIWARVQRRTDADFNSDGNMITMSVNGGDAVSIMDNTSNLVNSGTTSEMRLGRYTATGVVGEDGNLTLTINVKLGANVHWLSWRDVNYTKLDEATMSITSAKYATFCAPFDVAIPEGVTASTVTGVEKNVLTLSTVETTIPANTPVILYKEDVEEEIFTNTVYGKSTAEEDSYTVGWLTGVYEATPAPAGSYVLQNNNDKVGFYVVEDGKEPTVGANRAYLKDPESGAKPRAFFFNADDATAIATIAAMTAGEVEGIYTIGGAKVQSLQKGVNILKMKNGQTRKVIVK